jgi:ubiquinone/menaquinone biosynthesis C-methylase UbiE
MHNSERYETLIQREAKHWGAVQFDPQNPQIWHDPRLFEIFFGKEYRLFRERVLAHGPRVLELGCGDGKFSVEVAGLGLHVTGIDLSVERIERARQRAQSAGVADRTRFLADDLNTISLPSGEYDCVVAHDALHHIFAIDRLMEEVGRSLKPGGAFIVLDYAGMGRFWRILAAILYAVLPTYQPYQAKWQLRKRLKAFLANETEKRVAIALGKSASLHHDSPFEEISQRSIVPAIEKRFVVSTYHPFNPFFFYFGAKVRLPVGLKYIVARTLRWLDDFLLMLRLAHGAYFLLEAHKR